MYMKSSWTIEGGTLEHAPNGLFPINNIYIYVCMYIYNMCTCFFAYIYIYHLIARPNGTKIARKGVLTLLLNPRKQKQKMHWLQRKNFLPQPLMLLLLLFLVLPSPCRRFRNSSRTPLCIVLVVNHPNKLNIYISIISIITSPIFFWQRVSRMV